MAVVRLTLSNLIAELDTHILALTEVRRVDVLALLPEHLRSSWEAIRDTSGGQHDFDVALLLDRRFALLEHREYLETVHEGARIRCGLLAVLRLADGAALVVVVSHWRSDLGGHQAANAKRQAAAWRLKEAIGHSLRRFGPAHVVVLGDFNVEPYDPVLNALPTSRARSAVLRHRPKSSDDFILYNPAWRWMGEREPWSSQCPPTLAGSYYGGKSGAYSWRTVDQVLVSASLLSTVGWFFLEEVSGVSQPSGLFERSSGKLTKPIDHLPVVGRLGYQDMEAS